MMEAQSRIEFSPSLNPSEAPAGFYAVLKSDVAKRRTDNLCRACDWRPECQKSDGTDFTLRNHRCMDGIVINAIDGRELTRHDGCSVVFKRLLAGGGS